MSRRAMWSLVLVLALAGMPAGAVGPVDTGEVGPGYVATDNVEWLGNIAFNADSAGARVLDGYLYITDDRGLTIYDLSDPADPWPVGFTAVPQSPYFVEEDPDTNGEILLLSTYSDLTRGIGPLNQLNIIDVSDKANPSVRSSLPGAQQHTWSCVLDCTWGYGSGGLIADLTNPDAPRLSEHQWTDATRNLEPRGVTGAHDVTEIIPGIVLTSSNPVVLLDARDDPEQPTVLTTGDMPDNRFVHGNLWPREGTDRWALVGGETIPSRACGPNDGAFMTFDASAVDLSASALDAGDVGGEFVFVDEFRVEAGLPTDGNSPYNQYCAHWFTEHPDFADGGVVAIGWYEHGVRFLDIDDEGRISEVGYFLPFGGSTSAAYWVTDEILYTADYQRGIDILRFTGAPATAEVTRGVAATAAADLTPPTPSAAVRAARAAGLDRDPYACPLPGR